MSALAISTPIDPVCTQLKFRSDDYSRVTLQGPPVIQELAGFVGRCLPDEWSFEKLRSLPLPIMIVIAPSLPMALPLTCVSPTRFFRSQ